MFFFCACLFGVSYGTQASAATSIYRSVGPGATTALATGASNTLSIATSTATFASALPDNIGVGDVIQYDSDNNGTIDVIAFIHGRTSSTVYTVKTASGGTPTATTADDNDWSIFRAYISLGNAEAGIENTGIASGVRNFDTFSDSTGRNLVTADEWWNITVYAGQDGMADTSATIANWTTDATHYIKIYTPYDSTEVGTSQRHLGKLDTQKYYINTTATGNYSNNINVQQDYTRIEGLQTQMNTGGFSFISGIVLN
ncbi:MAG TPA: hypothetical protein VJH89_03985, partial [Patescibacteria group bacterium]|nr:hypothetical protein [Patescibacteria group bacterium]